MPHLMHLQQKTFTSFGGLENKSATRDNTGLLCSTLETILNQVDLICVFFRFPNLVPVRELIVNDDHKQYR